MHFLSRVYQKPSLIEYGHLSELTLGSGGTKPDFILTKTGIVLDPDDPGCAVADKHVTACLVSS